MSTETGGTSNELAARRTDLALTRTMMAAERTLMAWLRTALSLYSFGFTIYKVLEDFARSGVELNNPHSPRNIGLFMTGMGTLSMVIGCLEYWYRVKELKIGSALRRPVFFIAMFMTAVGVFLFTGILVKIL